MMKRIESFLFVFVFLLTVPSQTLHFEENFDYLTGKLTDLTSSWIELSASGSFDIEVSNGNLSYTDYGSSDIGRFITLNGGASGRNGIERTFPVLSENGNSIYVSFLLKVTSTTDMDVISSDGDYFANLNNGSLTNRAYVYVRQGSSASKFSIGFAKSSSTSLTWHSTELDVSTTYLIVLAYFFQSGEDAVRLWINPSLAGAEPTADLEITNGTDASSLEYLQFRQEEKSGDMEIDGVRVSNSWDQAPLPVELISFTAELIENSVNLKWQTATEVNNFGFDIERASNPFSTGWSKIGFVQGSGTTNSPKHYKYVDNELPNAEAISYRLKQIDNDGTSTYSKVVAVDLSSITSVDDDVEYQFSLEQNFPNPFNPSTTINFTVPKIANGAKQSVKTILKLYNVLGKQVAALVEKNLQPGNHKVNFDASELPSGIYFYKIEVGSQFHSTKKMVLLK